MLKIKDNVDLKELEKFGFKQMKIMQGAGNLETFYKYETDYDNYFIAECKNRIIIYNQFTVKNELDDKIYDLIKADLVEKVED